MGFTGRIAVALALVASLSSCLLTPGKFTSNLDIRRDRSFTFTYVGEVIAPPMTPGSSDSNDSDDSTTPPTESDGQPSSDFGGDAVMMKIAAKAKGGAKGNAATPDGALPAPETPADAKKMEALADALSHEYGYRSVKYLGNYRFAIDYAITGKLDHSFLFPFNVDGEVIIPFVVIELRGKDKIRLKAPGYARNENSGGGAMGGMGAMGGGSPASKEAENALDGVFTLTTDATIISQNQENGAETLPDGRKRITWRATPATKDAPLAVVQVNALP